MYNEAVVAGAEQMKGSEDSMLLTTYFIARYFN
jgi:hypothetical protein